MSVIHPIQLHHQTHPGHAIHEIHAVHAIHAIHAIHSSRDYSTPQAKSSTTVEQNASSHPDYAAFSRAETKAAFTPDAPNPRNTHMPTTSFIGPMAETQI